jgi:hypothetical protein
VDLERVPERRAVGPIPSIVGCRRDMGHTQSLGTRDTFSAKAVLVVGIARGPGPAPVVPIRRPRGRRNKQVDSPLVERRRGSRRAPSGLEKKTRRISRQVCLRGSTNERMAADPDYVRCGGVCKVESAHQPGSPRGHGRFPSDVGRLMLHRLQAGTHWMASC